MKNLNDLTHQEYMHLLEQGMLWEFYPQATGVFLMDCDSRDSIEILDDELEQDVDNILKKDIEADTDTQNTLMQLAVDRVEDGMPEFQFSETNSQKITDVVDFFDLMFMLYKSKGFESTIQVKIKEHPLYDDRWIEYNPMDDTIIDSQGTP